MSANQGWPERAWEAITKETDNEGEPTIFSAFTDHDAVIVFGLGDGNLIEIATYTDPRGVLGLTHGIVESVFMSRELFDKLATLDEEDE